jgi:hypothetical protein
MQPGTTNSPAQCMPQGAPRAGSGGSSGVEEEMIHPKSKATRRGPMDEMRQLVRPPSRCQALALPAHPCGWGLGDTSDGHLSIMQVRILVKVIPQSMNLVSAGPEGGGNNRISEEQIKCASVKLSPILHELLLVVWASGRSAL